MEKGSLIVFGRFPPPVDGQSLATRRFVSLVEESFDIVRINTNIPANASGFDKIRHYFKVGSSLRRTINRDPDAVVVWQSISPQVSGHFRDFVTVYPVVRRATTVAVVHWGSFAELFDSSLSRLTASRLVRALERVVFTTGNLSDACSPWIPDDRRAVISNTIDDETCCTEEEVNRKRDEFASGPFRVLYLSNMIREKGYLDVLSAAALLKDNDRVVQFEFVGHWSSETDRREFEHRIEREGLGEAVAHHGATLDRDEIKRFHLRAHAFVLPSYHPAEAQPLSILESLSAGTPVIASEAGGIPDLIRDGDEAFLIPVRSPEAIRDAVVRLTDEKTWLAMSLRARRRFLEEYHPGVVRRQWVELLHSVTSGGTRADFDV